MSIPTILSVQSVLTQLAKDFLFPADDISAGKYSKEDLHKLWYPDMPGSKEQLIETKSFDNVNIVHGGNTDGPALVLWPSLMMRGSLWSYQYEHFKNNFHVIMVDTPGVGKSDPLRKYFTLKDCCQCVVDILDALEIKKCIFGGNSWGAMMAVVFPAYFPDRLIASMAINGTASLPTTPETIVYTVRVESLMMNETVPQWWVEIARGIFSGETAAQQNTEFEAYIGCVSQEDPKSIAWGFRSVLLNRPDYFHLLPTIKNTPMMVVAGSEDRQFPMAKSKAMADAIPGCKFVTVNNTAHLAARENPELVNSIMDEWFKEVGVLK